MSRPVMTETADARSLPNDRAFVVQFAAGADVARGAVFGRVEHVRSAHGAHFETLDELLAFIDRALSGPSVTNESAR